MDGFFWGNTVRPKYIGRQDASDLKEISEGLVDGRHLVGSLCEIPMLGSPRLQVALDTTL